MPRVDLTIAQADKTTALLSSVGWILLIIVVSVVLFLLALWFKRRTALGDDHSPDVVGGGFTVGDLRRMRDKGDISDEEYERARERIVTAARVRMAQDAAKQGNPDKPSPDAPQVKNVDLIREAESP